MGVPEEEGGPGRLWWHYLFLNFVGLPEEDRTWLESEKQDGAEVGDVGVTTV